MLADDILRVFSQEKVRVKIQKGLPRLFQIAEIECSRAGKIGMEVGSVREQILIAMLLNVFDSSNVEAEIPITEPEIDVRVFGCPISIKTSSSRYLSSIKLIWTVDPQKAQEFRDNYEPFCDLLFVHVTWDNDIGGLYYIPVAVQQVILGQIGKTVKGGVKMYRHSGVKVYHL